MLSLNPGDWITGYEDDPITMIDYRNTPITIVDYRNYLIKSYFIKPFIYFNYILLYNDNKV